MLRVVCIGEQIYMGIYTGTIKSNAYSGTHFIVGNIKMYMHRGTNMYFFIKA